MEIQYDFFNNTVLDQLREEIKVLSTRSDNVRKGLFSRHNELAKLYYKMSEDFSNMYEKISIENDCLRTELNLIKMHVGIEKENAFDLNLQKVG